MITKLQIQKSYFLLDKCNLSLGEIQNRTVVQRVVKKGHKPKEGIDLRPIVKTPHRIKGTSIPASTLSRFKNREIKLGRTSARKLSSMYGRLMFQKLRGAGVNQKEARRLRSSSPDDIKKIISDYHRYARKIQGHYEQSYYDTVKAFKKQEKDKLKKPAPKPEAPRKAPEPREVPEPREEGERFTDDDSFEQAEIISQYEGDADTYLDEEPEEAPEEYAPEDLEIKEPPENDYPSLDEVIFGMGESEHMYSQWDGIVEKY